MGIGKLYIGMVGGYADDFIDIDNTEALHKYHSLLSAVLRLLTSTFVNRGIHNTTVQSQARQFLLDYRPNMVGVFKRYDGIGNAAAKPPSEELRDLVRSYIALLSITDFIKVGQVCKISQKGSS